MTDTCHDLVVITLADHLGVDPLAIEGRQRLQEDWGLDALDVAILALRLEDQLEIALPGAALDELRTVAELEALVRCAPALFDDELGLGPIAVRSLREDVRRTPARARRRRTHRQLRRALRRHAAGRASDFGKL